MYDTDPELRTLYYSPRVIIFSPTVPLAESLFYRLMSLYPGLNAWLVKGESEQKIPYEPDPEVFVCTPIQMLHLTQGFTQRTREMILNRTELVVFDEADAITRHFVGKALAAEIRYGIRTYPEYFITKEPEQYVRREIQRVYACTGYTSSNNIKDSSVYDIPDRYMDEPDVVDSNSSSLSTRIEHVFKYVCGYPEKLKYLLEAINTSLELGDTQRRMIVFCRSDSSALDLWNSVNSHISNSGLSERASVSLTERREFSSIHNISDFLNPFPTDSPCKLQILIATDIYSRGIDFSGISEVIHFDHVLSIKNYIHRCGRTGRFNQKGRSVSLAVNSEAVFASSIERFLDNERLRAPASGK